MTTEDRFPRWLDLTMENRGISGKDLARRLKIHDSAISRWRTGQLTPSLDSVMKLARALNVDAIRLAVTAGLMDPELVGASPLPLPEPTVQRRRVKSQILGIKGLTAEEQQVLVETYDELDRKRRESR